MFSVFNKNFQLVGRLDDHLFFLLCNYLLLETHDEIYLENRHLEYLRKLLASFQEGCNIQKINKGCQSNYQIPANSRYFCQPIETLIDSLSKGKVLVTKL